MNTKEILEYNREIERFYDQGLRIAIAGGSIICFLIGVLSLL